MYRTLWTWGVNTFGSLGDGTTIYRSSPVQVGLLTNWAHCYNGVYCGFGIENDGSLWSWGLNTSGQLGDGTTVNKSSPVQIGALTDWAQVDGGDHIVAIKVDGTLWVWGTGSNGALGDGTTINKSSPVQIGADTDWVFVTASSGVNGNGDFSLAIKSNGTLWVWGKNDSGQLGDGTTVRRSSPVQIGTDADTFTSIAAGSSHTLAVRTDGTLWSWGDNFSGQLGDSPVTSFDRSSPVQVGALTDWAYVSAGAQFSLAIKTDGTLWSWGSNAGGRLGLNSLVSLSRSSPTQVGALTDWMIVEATTATSNAIKTNGSIWAWGGNSNGELGDGTTINRSSPVQIGSFADWIDLTEGSGTSAARSAGITYFGSASSPADNGSQQEPNTATITPPPSMQAGDFVYIVYQSMANNATFTTQGGQTWNDLGLVTGTYFHQAYWCVFNGTWSANPAFDFASVGGNAANTVVMHVFRPPTTGWSWEVVNAFASTIVSVATNDYAIAGQQTPYPLTVSVAAVYSDDDNTWGDPATTPWANPGWTKLGDAQYRNLAGSDMSCAFAYLIRHDARWAPPVTLSQTGLGPDTGAFDCITFRAVPPVPAALTDYKLPAFDGTEDYLVRGPLLQPEARDVGALWTWGNGVGGILGDGTTIDKSSPIQVGSLIDWRQVERDYYNLSAIKTDGTLWTCGTNSDGDVGDGTTINRSSPVQIGALTDWVFISSSNTKAIKTDGTLWAWGAGRRGVLGDGTTIYKSSPVQIGALTDWAQVSGGFRGSINNDYTTAIKANGTLWAWGSNTNGELGDGTAVSKSSPIQIGALADWLQVSGTTAIKIDGTLWAWGYNTNGELGDGTTVSKSSPIQIGTLTDWRYVSGGNSYVLAIKANGTLWAWGYNITGQLGDGTTVHRSSPVQIGALTDWSLVNTNGVSLAIKTDGTVWAWGNNGSGLVGDGTTVHRSSPVQIGALTDWASRDIRGSHINRKRGFVSAVVNFTGGDGTQQKILTGYRGSVERFTLERTASNTIKLQIAALGARPLAVEVGTEITSARGKALIEASWNTDATGSISVSAENPDLVSGFGDAYGVGQNNNGELGVGNATAQTALTAVVGSHIFKVLRAGDGNSGGIDDAGVLWMWGTNIVGGLGTNTGNIGKSSPVQVSTATDWATFDVNRHVLAIKNDGSLYAWGWNDWGTVGDGTGGSTNHRSSPIQLGAAEWESASTGDSHSLAIKTNGTLWAWGANSGGQLGDGTAVSKSSPVQVGGLTDWAQVSGGAHSLAIKDNGTLWGWGPGSLIGDGTTIYKSSPVQIGALSWTAIAVGNNYSLAVRDDGTLWAWGYNTVGRLGTSENVATVHSSPVQVGTLSNWVDVRAHTSCSLFLNSANEIWGAGSGLRFGAGAIQDFSSPVQIGASFKWIDGDAAPSGVMALRAQSSYSKSASVPYRAPLDMRLDSWAVGGTPTGTMLATADIGEVVLDRRNIATLYGPAYGTLWAWGSSNISGEFGDGTAIPKSSPVQIGAQHQWVKVLVTRDNNQEWTLALKKDGTLWGWGYNAGGTLGLNDSISRSSPVQIGSLTDWSENFAVSNVHSVVLRNNGLLWAWGANNLGSLGDGTTVSKSSPIQIGSVATWKQVACPGFGTTYAIKKDGTLWAWGLNTNGRLGDGTTISKSSPVQIGALTDWDILGDGGIFSIKTNGTLWAIGGSNSFGQLGDGTTIDRSSPVQIGALTDWSSVSYGELQVHAIKNDGTLWAWGYNQSGKLGDGTAIDRSSPVQIGALTDWSKVSDGSSQSLAIKSDRSLWAWGVNAGMFGNGTTTGTQSPIQIGTDKNWVLVAAGRQHVIALRGSATFAPREIGRHGSLPTGVQPDVYLHTDADEDA